MHQFTIALELNIQFQFFVRIDGESEAKSCIRKANTLFERPAFIIFYLLNWVDRKKGAKLEKQILLNLQLWSSLNLYIQPLCLSSVCMILNISETCCSHQSEAFIAYKCSALKYTWAFILCVLWLTIATNIIIIYRFIPSTSSSRFCDLFVTINSVPNFSQHSRCGWGAGGDQLTS